jgi:alpha-L-fucosidase
MKKVFALFTAALIGAVPLFADAPAKTTGAVASPNGTDVFQPDWKNISEHYQIPEWFKDAKFGIFIHWGVYSVPAFSSEWYPRNMYIKGSNVWGHHIRTYGTHDKFGYKDFIPLFKAEKFDATEWAALFKEAGAKYIVPVAEHHDGFAMYDSAHNPWNAVKMGPKKDIIALLKAAVEKEGLVFGLSSHRLENNWFYNGKLDKTGLFKGDLGFPSDTLDKTITLYGQRLARENYNAQASKDFLAHTRELIDKYHPQLIWFDWSVHRIRPAFNQFLAYYYNSALDWGKGVVVNTKTGYPNNIQVSDIERGKSAVMQKHPWQTDTSIGTKSWSHIKLEKNKTPKQIVHDLVDIVSKNGNLLLNIGPRADGSITDEQKSVLLAIGQWLKVNGEAIYGTRVWIKFGEGATKGTSGGFSDNRAIRYTKADLRFTTRGNTLYAIALGWGDALLIRSLTPATVADAKLLDVTLLGADGKLRWEQTPEGLRVTLPSTPPCEYAYAVRLTFDKPVGAHLPHDWEDKPFKY